MICLRPGPTTRAALRGSLKTTSISSCFAGSRRRSSTFLDPAMAQLFGGVINKPRAGTVIETHENTMARLSGLREARLHNLIEFEEGYGVVFDLERNSVAVALLDPEPPALGSEGRLSDKIVGIPVGEGMLGRVVDPLGRPIPELDPEGGAPIDESKLHGLKATLDVTTPSIIARKPLCRRLVTGIKAVDAFHPLGHGQCLALLGKRSAGKSSLVLHVIANQRGLQGDDRVHCVYVAIGQEEKAIKRTVAKLQKEGCLDYVTIIAAPVTATSGMRFLAPHAGATLAEYFRDKGGRSLVIIDDVTSHSASNAEFARFIPKLGPEAGGSLGLYGPLFERFAQLSDAKGGGSMTGLMVVEGEALEGAPQSALAESLNSIADHAIMLNAGLARKKVFPAVDVTYQMNLQNPGSALLPEPMKAFVQNLRTVLAELIDEEAGAETAERLGLKVADEEEERAERLVYLNKIRELFRQEWGERVDDETLLLYLLCSLKGFLQDMDLKAVKQLNHVITTELPKAKGWKRLSKELQRLLASPSAAEDKKVSMEETVRIYQEVYDVLWNAVGYSKMKSFEQQQEGPMRIREAARAALAARKKK